ncbi:MAG: hypothetical protein ABW150_15745 [Candidatus Thiodiazotropha sp.]
MELFIVLTVTGSSSGKKVLIPAVALFDEIASETSERPAVRLREFSWVFLGEFGRGVRPREFGRVFGRGEVEVSSAAHAV